MTFRELNPETREDDEEADVAGSFATEEANQIPYSGKDLDLAPALREQLLLALPMDAPLSRRLQGPLPDLRSQSESGSLLL